MNADWYQRHPALLAEKIKNTKIRRPSQKEIDSYRTNYPEFYCAFVNYGRAMEGKSPLPKSKIKIPPITDRQILEAIMELKSEGKNAAYTCAKHRADRIPTRSQLERRITI
jgi:hypothetical protein